MPNFTLSEGCDRYFQKNLTTQIPFHPFGSPVRFFSYPLPDDAQNGDWKVDE